MEQWSWAEVPLPEEAPGQSHKEGTLYSDHAGGVEPVPLSCITELELLHVLLP